MVIRRFAKVILPTLFTFFLVKTFAYFNITIFVNVVTRGTYRERNLNAFNIVKVRRVTGETRVRVLRVFRGLTRLL